MENPYTHGCDRCKIRIKLNHVADEKQSLLESEQHKFANEFREKYGDGCWNEQDSMDLFQQ